MSNNPCHHQERSVRELGGEIWSELSQRVPEGRVSWDIKNEVVGLVMGILARHAGELIENDPDVPVPPTEPIPGGVIEISGA